MSQSLIHLENFSSEQIVDLISKAQKIKSNQKPVLGFERKTFGLLFFEPSTRTRVSFERAVHLVGANAIAVSGNQGTSIQKGESLEETVLNIEAMGLSGLIIRSDESLDQVMLSQNLKTPVISGGWGQKAHPTQALLDLMTLRECFGNLQGLRVLFAGDLKHSRVLASHRQLLPKFGVEVGYWAPQFLQLKDFSPNEQVFKSKKEALDWAQCLIGLRLQKERFSEISKSQSFDLNFQIQAQDLSHDPQKIIFHPGPVGWGDEFDFSIKKVPGNRILQQVTNGVYLRAAVLDWLGGRA